MMLVALPGKIVENHNHTIVMMDGGDSRRAVCVLRDDRIGDVRSKLGLIETIASRKLDHGELAFDGRVWITPSDLPRPGH